MTQTELGEAIGSNQGRIYKWENGMRKLVPADAQRLATILGCHWTQLLVEGDDIPETAVTSQATKPLRLASDMTANAGMTDIERPFRQEPLAPNEPLPLEEQKRLLIAHLDIVAQAIEKSLFDTAIDVLLRMVKDARAAKSASKSRPINTSSS